MDNYKKELKIALEKAGLTDERMLKKIEELIKTIEVGDFKPRNKEKKLEQLKADREELLERIKAKN